MTAHIGSVRREDHALPVRRAVLSAMKACRPLTDLVPAASIYPATVPSTRTFPFTRFDPPIVMPFALSGLDSSRVRFTVSVFGKSVANEADVIIMTAEDVVVAAASVIEGALDGAILRLPSGMAARPVWVRTSARQDRDEADAWSASVGFDAEVSG